MQPWSLQDTVEENSKFKTLPARIGRAQKGGLREAVPLEEEGAVYEENHQGGVRWCQAWKAASGEGESIVSQAGTRSWIGQRELFIDRKSSSFSEGHEPGWLEPKQTAGVEMWLWQQV